jgi:hypothetical protein
MVPAANACQSVVRLRESCAKILDNECEVVLRTVPLEQVESVFLEMARHMRSAVQRARIARREDLSRLFGDRSVCLLGLR